MKLNTRVLDPKIEDAWFGFSNVLGSLCVILIGFSNVLSSLCVILLGFPMFWAPYVSLLLVFQCFGFQVCTFYCFFQFFRVLETENLGKTNKNHNFQTVSRCGDSLKIMVLWFLLVFPMLWAPCASFYWFFECFELFVRHFYCFFQ